MTKPRLPAFDPADLAESNATSYPDKFKPINSRRWNRRLGDHVGLKNFGVNLTRIEPGAQSSARHAHAKQDEFIWVIEGEVVLETNEGSQTLRPGMCAGFPASTGNAHRFVNKTDKSVLLLVVGVWRMISTPATPPVIGEDDPDFTRVGAILACAEDAPPDANLALLGDKRFLFSESGESFMMFGVRGRSWIALGAPIGKRCERSDLLWRFRELADAHAARPGIYNIGPDDLPDLIREACAESKVALLMVTHSTEVASRFPRVDRLENFNRAALGMEAAR